jgi:sulfite reductase alpha subunit-like flavoprotein
MACRSTRRYRLPTIVLTTGSEIPVGLVRGGMRPPESDIPCIFIGPGTGIAPMRAMIEQRVHENSKGFFIISILSLKVDNLLIFGNRNKAKDYLFESEWNGYQSSDNLTVLFAFSRDRPMEKKTYVQDIVSRNAKTVYDYLINRNGVLFISGSAGKMPQAVKEAVIEIIRIEQGITKEQAQEVHAKVEKQGRWKQETW